MVIKCYDCGEDFETKIHNAKYCKKCKHNRTINKGKKFKDSRTKEVAPIENTDLSVFDVLNEEQKKQFLKASPQRQVWLIEFVRTGSVKAAAEKAYPKANQNSRNTVNSYLSAYFGITVADIFRAMGINESKIAEKTLTLLDAKRQVRTFKKGDLIEEVEQEDSFAINAGLGHATKLLKIDPAQKILHGEDPDNKFTSLADALKSIASGVAIKQRPEEAPNI